MLGDLCNHCLRMRKCPSCVIEGLQAMWHTEIQLVSGRPRHRARGSWNVLTKHFKKNYRRRDDEEQAEVTCTME